MSWPSATELSRVEIEGFSDFTTTTDMYGEFRLPP